jgi:serine phosphatase RsbU (regulator of sigma subunit)/DNA-binding response OmpR family regulator
MTQGASSGYLTALIVDGDPLSAGIISEIINQEYRIVICGSVEEFHVKIKSELPDLAFICYQLPDGSGIDICSKLKSDSRLADTAVIIMVSDCGAEMLEKCFAAGADDYLKKPFIKGELIQRIRIHSRLIASRRGVDNINMSLFSYNAMLYRFGGLTHKIMTDEAPDSHIRAAGELHYVVPHHYTGFVHRGVKQVTVLKQDNREPDLPVMDYGTLTGRGRLDPAGTSSVLIDLSDGNISLHLCAVTFKISDNSYVLLVERVQPFSSEEHEIITLFSEFLKTLVKREMSERLLSANIKQYRAEISKIRKIQVSMLPSFKPLMGFDAASAYLPAAEISGDFYDGYFINENTYQVIVCDVSGHGIASAYVGNEIRTIFRNSAYNDSSLDLSLFEINNILINDMKKSDYFCTAIVLRINIDDYSVEFLSAGHPPAYLHRVSDGSTRCLTGTGPFLGVIPRAEFEIERFSMQSGDTLLLYTDGLTETFNYKIADDQMYGEGRLLESFSENIDMDSTGIVHSILGSVLEFSEYGEQYDDITIVSLRRR